MKHVGRNEQCTCGSGRKYKRCCEPIEKFIKTSLNQVSRQVGKTIEDYLGDVMSHLTIHGQLRGKHGSDVISALMCAIETLAEDTVKRHSVTSWFKLIRQWDIGSCYREVFSPSSRLICMRITESLVFKYAPRHRTAGAATELSPKSIGVHLVDLAKLYYLVAWYKDLVEAHYAVNSGGAVVLVREPKWRLEMNNPPEVESSLDLFKKRQHRFVFEDQEDLLSVSGMTFQSDMYLPLDGKPYCLGATGADLLGHRAKQISQFGLDPDLFVFCPRFIDLSELHESVGFDSQEFQKAHHLPWEVYAACLHTLGTYVSTALSGHQHVCDLFYRGYGIINTNVLRGLLFHQAHRVFALLFPHNLQHTEDRWASFVEAFLKLATPDPILTDVAIHEPVHLIVRVDDESLINVAETMRFVADHIRAVLLLAYDNKGVLAEKQVSRLLAKRSPRVQACLRPNQQFKKTKKVRGEADLSFRVGTVYVPVDVKSYAANARYLRGEHSAVKTRWENVEKWICQAEQLSSLLSTYPRGDNYDLIKEGFTHVLPVVCSPYPEVFLNTGERYMLSPQLPRVMTPVELADFLANVSEDELKRHWHVAELSSAN